MIAVTSRKLCGRPLPDQVALVADAGPELIILREKDLGHAELLALASECLAACRSRGVPMSVNTDVSAARELRIPNVHLPLAAMRTADVSGLTVGVSVHSAEEAVEAEALGADYLVAGHVFPTACKIGEPRGTGFLRSVCDAVSIPVYAIGGVNPDNYGRVLEAGAAGGAAMSSVMADDPSEAVRGMPATGCGIRLRLRKGN
ncbi:MAG: thiamine phosphate synthase [Thermoplasmata archaeon]|nr:thiamine phosphate synthase [Thermoplasmata archaeon]